MKNISLHFQATPCTRVCIPNLSELVDGASWQKDLACLRGVPVSSRGGPRLEENSKQRGSIIVVFSSFTRSLARCIVLVIVDLLATLGSQSCAQSLCERLPAMHAPATNARSTAINSRRDFFLIGGVTPLVLIGFLRVTWCFVCKNIW
jgi:hypothetical protein